MGDSIKLNMPDREKHCLRILAKLFNDGKTGMLAKPREILEREGLTVDYQSYVILMKMMEQYGALGSKSHVLSEEGQYRLIMISPVAVQIVRELDEFEKKARKAPGSIRGWPTSLSR